MCGLAGIVRFDDAPIAPQRAEAMLAQLRHRGPDGEGVATHRRCTLIHTRLSIIDLLGGHQPMEAPAHGSCGQLSLLFNGEIYNHRELRHKLENLGHQFVSDHCDTEVLLHGFRAYGTELPKHLHGMFAFALWDATEQRLFLCRDRTGEKPLFIRRSADRRELMFASLVSALVMGLPPGERPEIDAAALQTYLRLGYTRSQSLIASIEEIPAAHWMAIDRYGVATAEPYWRPPPVSRSSTSLGAVESTREVLVEAVTKRLEADVPLGCFLSGGIDSSLIAAIAQRGLAQRGHGPLQTFSVKMPDVAFDESVHAQSVASHIGSQHIELTAAPDANLFDDLERLVAVSGEPTADSSLLATYWLSRATRPHVKVALSGDGGDELFGGYDRYRAMRLLARHRWWLERFPRGMLAHANPRSTRTRLRRLVEAAAAPTPPQQYHQMIHLFTQTQLRDMGLPYGSEGLLPPVPDWPEDEPEPVHASMRWDLSNYLPFDLLRKVDRASMAVALEVRAPMLDTQVCDLAGHLPVSVLMPDGRPKGLLRRVAQEFLPDAIVRRPKRGFAIPIGRWFAQSLHRPLADRLLDGTLERLHIARRPVETMLHEHAEQRVDHTHRLFALLGLCLWRRWLDAPSAPPPAFG